METGLRLLMGDGAIHVAFHPRLTADQYSELIGVVAAAEVTAWCSRTLVPIWPIVYFDGIMICFTEDETGRKLGGTGLSDGLRP